MTTTAPDLYSSARFALTIDGLQGLTNLRSVEGGATKADSVTYQFGEGREQYKVVGKTKIDDVKMSLGLSTVAQLWTWLGDFTKGKVTRRNGSIIAADHNYDAKARRDFKEAFISEIGFPKWDAADKNAVNVSVTLAVEQIEYKPASGSIFDEKGKDEINQREIKACHFLFSLDPFKDACARTAKVDAMSVKLKVIEHHVSTQLQPIKLPGTYELPNLVFYVPEADAKPFTDYLDGKIVPGKSPSGGIHGKLDYYSNKGPTALQGGFEFKGVHIISVSPEKHDTGSEDTKLVKVECVMESMTFKPK